LVFDFCKKYFLLLIAGDLGVSVIIVSDNFSKHSTEEEEEGGGLSFGANELNVVYRRGQDEIDAFCIVEYRPGSSIGVEDDKQVNCVSRRDVVFCCTLRCEECLCLAAMAGIHFSYPSYLSCPAQPRCRHAWAPNQRRRRGLGVGGFRHCRGAITEKRAPAKFLFDFEVLRVCF